MRPSRRNTTRSAHDASCASWVTITPATPRALGPDETHDAFAVDRVQRSAGLVGEQQPALADDGAGDCHPLSLTTGQLVRVAPRPIGQPELVERGDRNGTGRPGAGAVQLQRQRDILGRRQPGQQVEILEDIADSAAAKSCPIVARHARHIRPADEDLAGRGVLEGPAIVSSVLLPEPLGPITATSSPACTRQVDVSARPAPAWAPRHRTSTPAAAPGAPSSPYSNPSARPHPCRRRGSVDFRG